MNSGFTTDSIWSGFLKNYVHLYCRITSLLEMGLTSLGDFKIVSNFENLDENYKIYCILTCVSYSMNLINIGLSKFRGKLKNNF